MTPSRQGQRDTKNKGKEDDWAYGEVGDYKPWGQEQSLCESRDCHRSIWPPFCNSKSSSARDMG